MANRHALLIGVPRYDDEEFNEPRLADAVACDIEAMRASLQQSKYEITDCGVPGTQRGDATLNRINQAIEEACASAPVDGVLLIYFSGHGLTLDNRDYLVPSDSYRSNAAVAAGHPAVRSLIPVVPALDVLATCRARLVIFFADACRDERIADGRAGHGLPMEPVGQQPYLANGGHFILVMGCEVGQVCQYDENGSTFTQALAKVLDPSNSARTLAEVMTEVHKDMERRSRLTQDVRQVPVVRYPDMLTLAGQIPVCDGDELSDAWIRAVEASPLLELCDYPDQVKGVVVECAGHCRRATAALASRTGLTDPWTDPDYPGRVLRRAEALLKSGAFLGGQATDGLGPRSGEAALLLAAPFLREAVLAVGIQDAAGITPESLKRTYKHGARNDLELTHEMHQHLVRRAEGLRRRGGSEPGAADSPDVAKPGDKLAMWLVHRWLADRTTLWHEEGAAEIWKLGVGLAEGCRGSVDAGELPKLVQAIVLAVAADPGDDRLQAKLISPYMNDRWRVIAAVLWLAGITAVDQRRLPPVAPDLVGTGMELSPAEIQAAAGRGAVWEQSQDGALELHLVCHYPSLHAVFDDIVLKADRAAQTIRSELGIPAALVDRLPRRYTAAGLRAATRGQDDGSMYDVPLPRFQIAEEKVRELLMGRQLYGDPTLAIRELYQNALDACRWRETRQEYRRRRFGEPASWSGRITFTQGIDGGRPYIDCEDNGVGMDSDTLKHVFANAGERFVYQQGFRAEQADWAMLEKPLRMVSNSQFGVGVFSYFMLADEIEVLTRRQGRNGVSDANAQEVSIASSGSLFRIQSAQGMPGAGTRVRLYLSGETSEISVLGTLRDLLWLSEFQVEVFEGEEHEIWQPAELRYPDATVPALCCEDDLWWVSGEGGLAADGIRTSEDRFGLVLNLRDDRRPQFTVDRRSLEVWDEEWVRQTIGKSLPHLMDWPGFTLAWLWQVADSDPGIAQQIFIHAAAAGRDIKIGTPSAQSASVALGVVGCLPSDSGFFDREGGYRSNWLAVWRMGVWRELVAAQARAWRRNPAECTTGFPVPDPLDATLIDNLQTENPNEALSKDSIVVALADPELSVVTRLRRLRRYAITGINLSKTRYVPAIDVQVREEDTELLRALAAWSRPGKPTDRTNFAGSLMLASLRLGQSVGEVLRRAQRLAPPDWIGPDLNLGELRYHTFTQAEVRLLTLNLHMTPPIWLEGQVVPSHLIKASEWLGRPVHDILKMYDQLVPLGVTVAMRKAYPRELEPAEFYALAHVDQPGQVLSPLQLVLVAGNTGISVGAAHTALGRLEQSGLIVRPELRGPAEFIPGPNEISLLENDLQDWGGPGRRRKKFLETPCQRIVHKIKGRGGWADKLAANNIAPFADPTAEIGSAEIAQLSYELGVTIAEAAERFLEIYPEALLPVISADCAGLKVDFGIHDAMLPYGRENIKWRLGVRDIIADAFYLRMPLGDFLGLLKPFRSFGAPVPAFDESVRDVLNQVELDEYDTEMLREFDELGEERELETITSLDLVRIAGRLGWTLAHAHRRFERLVPVGLTLDYPQVELPDAIVYWYDLLLLTTYFDGQPPVITGGIDRAYLESAALEIFDCTPGEIPAKAAFLRDRLRIYAPLFHFEFPEESIGAVG